MIKEGSLYEGKSKYFKIQKNEQKTINLTLFKTCLYEMKYTLLSGNVYDLYTGKPLENTLVVIRFDCYEIYDFTDYCGYFKMMIPHCVSRVKISFCKNGFIAQINSYEVKDHCNDIFKLY